MDRHRHHLGGAEPEGRLLRLGPSGCQQGKDGHVVPGSRREAAELGLQQVALLRHGQQDEVGKRAMRRIGRHRVGLHDLEARAHERPLQPVGPERRITEEQDPGMRKGVPRCALSHAEGQVKS